MFAKVTLPENLKETLQYHDRKIRQGKAEFLYAGNFFKDYDQLSKNDKIYHFERRNALNDEVRKNTVQVSLSWHPSENLSNEKMTGLVREYLGRMGFGDQPYLAYKHLDELHPHAHVVATNIQRNGKKIFLRKKELYKSLQITRELEIKHSLVASGRRRQQQEGQGAYRVQKFVRGETPVKPILSEVLRSVIPSYRYTSIDELNAVLGLYNIRAEAVTGAKNGQARKGLVFKPLGADGRPENGLNYIKASDFPFKPTLDNLEQKFSANQSLREAGRQRVVDSIDLTLFNISLSPSAFQTEMQARRISTVFQQDKEGGLKNIWYVDHDTKAVFDGGALGNRYTAASISQRCVTEEVYQQEQVQQQQRLRHRLPSGL